MMIVVHVAANTWCDAVLLKGRKPVATPPPPFPFAAVW